MRFAIIEDDPNQIGRMELFLKQFSSEKHLSYSLDSYNDSECFLAANEDYDLCFFDIELPGLDGISCAKKYRGQHDNTIIIFITNMQQLALKGYEVQALAFLIKPLLYSDFVFNLNRALQNVGKTKHSLVSFIDNNETYVIDSDSVMYVEVNGHTVTFFTEHETITKHGRLYEIEEKLEQHGFIRCNRYCLINYRFVISADRDNVVMTTTSIPISRSQKKTFMSRLSNFIS